MLLWGKPRLTEVGQTNLIVESMGLLHRTTVDDFKVLKIWSYCNFSPSGLLKLHLLGYSF
ncbi:hypothetical protein RchiOBHm_Chr2g0143391 [Rosa chinensis]|uniref:Uncharacterized protein n=1 Tax=Rosa chinensis TaxID=74649 RepID=A0A2P6RY37_ROSCH|nr:hypothetical protein RchiOBHm_Chr2g0143391 [Rosa chinensis]